MKKLVNVVEVENEGLAALLGERVEVWCLNYIYVGTLAGVNTDDILLENCALVYETGPNSDAKFKDMQPFGQTSRYIRTAVIESYAKAKDAG